MQSLIVLGNPRLSDMQTRRKLGRLLELYFLTEDGNSPALPAEESTQTESGSGKGNTGERKRQLEWEGLGETNQSAKKQRTGDKAEYGGSPDQNQTTFCPILQRKVRAYWSLGPEATTEDAGASIRTSDCSLNPCNLSLRVWCVAAVPVIFGFLEFAKVLVLFIYSLCGCICLLLYIYIEGGWMEDMDKIIPGITWPCHLAGLVDVGR